MWDIGFAPEHNRDIQTQDEARGVCMTMGIARPHACAGGTIPWNGRGAGGHASTLAYIAVHEFLFTPPGLKD